MKSYWPIAPCFMNEIHPKIDQGKKYIKTPLITNYEEIPFPYQPQVQLGPYLVFILSALVRIWN